MRGKTLLFVIGLIVLAAVGRLLPHPPNFVPFMAIGLFGAAMVRPKLLALVIPFAALVLSDMLLGTYTGIGWIYFAFILCSLPGFTLSNSFHWGKLAVVTISSSILFFIISNFGVWISSGMYSLDLNGFITCFTLAIPFFRNSLLSDLMYSGVLFGAYRFVSAHFALEKSASTV